MNVIETGERFAYAKEVVEHGMIVYRQSLDIQYVSSQMYLRVNGWPVAAGSEGGARLLARLCNSEVVFDAWSLTLSATGPEQVSGVK